MQVDTRFSPEHEHTFGQELIRPGEKRTQVVIMITATTMLLEIVAGVAFGSMALLADGLHMASHTVALAINAFAYSYARKHAGDSRFSLGTGKVNALGGFTGAVLLAAFAMVMAAGSVERLINPTSIAFTWAITVAAVGLLVNAASALILNVRSSAEEHRAHADQRHHDHNLRSAYLHVMADALTSVLAVVALLAAKYFGLTWMDPVMGIVGAALVTRWSLGLLRVTSSVLLDQRPSEQMLEAVRKSIESDGDSRVTDLHIWSIGPGIYAAVVSVAASRPLSSAAYKERLPRELGLEHVSIEVNHPQVGR